MERDRLRGDLIKRLNVVSGLHHDEKEAILSLPINVREMEAGRAIVRDGDRPLECCLIAEGFCYRTKTTAGGQRQILSLHIPGEIPDLQSLHLHVLDHDLCTLTACTLGFISHVALRAVTRAMPRLAELLWRDTLIDASMFREWILNVGQRPAPSRLAHIISELRERLSVIDKVQGNVFPMPLTQERLGEAMGVSAVHANRVVKQLREEKVVDFSRGQVTILDENKLQALAGFDRRYLHQKPSL